MEKEKQNIRSKITQISSVFFSYYHASLNLEVKGMKSGFNIPMLFTVQILMNHQQQSEKKNIILNLMYISRISI